MGLKGLPEAIPIKTDFKALESKWLVPAAAPPGPFPSVWHKQEEQNGKMTQKPSLLFNDYVLSIYLPPAIVGMGDKGKQALVNTLHSA